MPLPIIQEIKRIRGFGPRELDDGHPNLGADKIYPLLLSFCLINNLQCPKIITINRIIKDLGGLRITPQRISHFGKTKETKKKKILRKPKDFEAKYPGHLVSLDTIEIIINGIRRYIITFEDIYTRFSFSWATKSHASLAAKEFFEKCLKVFTFPFQILDNTDKAVLTDNGSEFKKLFDEELKKLHLLHYHTYPHSPKMNAHLERFNRTLQDEFVDFNHDYLLNDIDEFNRKLMNYLTFYNTQRVHYAFKNKLSPVQFMLQLQQESMLYILDEKSKIGCEYTKNFFFNKNNI